MQQSSTTIAVLTHSGVDILTQNGDLLQHDHSKAKRFLQQLKEPFLSVHGKSLIARLRLPKNTRHYELLELFAFVRPTEFCVPTPSGLQEALAYKDNDKGAHSVAALKEKLLAELKEKTDHVGFYWELAKSMEKSGWWCGREVVNALAQNPHKQETTPLNPYAVWDALREWQEVYANNDDHADISITPEESSHRLKEWLGNKPETETRPSQKQYCEAITYAFQSKNENESPHLVLAEGGTGIGKTHGYLAPATLWSEKNGAPVWVSTFTRNLQHQIYEAPKTLYGNENSENRTVIRKGRNNYLCLSKYADIAETALGSLLAEQTIPAALMAIWILHSKDGDLNSDSYPSWLADIVKSYDKSHELADTRRECNYSACRFYGKCFIERSVRKARQADIVAVNHALLIENFRILARQDGDTIADYPRRVVFDEGHHLFHAADSAFSDLLSATAMAEVRHWLIGSEKNKNKIAQGLKIRLRGLITTEGEETLEKIIEYAQTLPEQNLPAQKANGQNYEELTRWRAPSAAKQFLTAIYQMTETYAKHNNIKHNNYYGCECPIPKYEKNTIFKEIIENANILKQEFQAFAATLKELKKEIGKGMTGSENEQANRYRLALQLQAIDPVTTWMDMLDELVGDNYDSDNYDNYGEDNIDPPRTFSWLGVERSRGKLTDIGYYRHYIDPMGQFYFQILKNIDGGVITSATLTDHAEGDEDYAFRRSRFAYIKNIQKQNIEHYRLASPFDYAEQASVIIVGDINRDDSEQTAHAFADLFRAAGGGAMGIFTAIKALRDSHPIIQQELMKENMPLYAQHVDDYHLPDLIRIFKYETDSCILGTDALRDGVDVPGESLRLIVLDKVPWPRRSLLLQERSKFFGRDYSTVLARLALRQAFGRLIRNKTDRGVFVILDNRVSRQLASAFPTQTPIKHMSLASACDRVHQFLT